MLKGRDKLQSVRRELWPVADALEKRPGDWAITSGLRTNAEQLSLWQKGRDALGNVIGITVTNAKTAELSAHGRGAALDFAPIDAKGNVAPDYDPRWNVIGEVAEALGFEWGGRWTNPLDKPHVQIPGWKSLPFAVASGGAVLVLLGVGVWLLLKRPSA